MALEKHRKGLKAENEESGYVLGSTNLHHGRYVPPTFAGSLGKPTLSTVNYPRQVNLFFRGLMLAVLFAWRIESICYTLAILLLIEPLNF